MEEIGEKRTMRPVTHVVRKRPLPMGSERASSMPCPIDLEEEAMDI